MRCFRSTASAIGPSLGARPRGPVRRADRRGPLRARTARRQRAGRARRICDGRPGDRCALRRPDRGLGRAPAARPGRHRRSRRNSPSPAERRSSTCRPTRRNRRAVLWSAFDPTVLTVADDPTSSARSNAPTSTRAAHGLLMPPPEPQERAFLDRFFGERLSRNPGADRISAAPGGCGRASFRPRDFRESTRRGGSGRSGSIIARVRRRAPVRAPIDVLEDAYSWADRLATHFAQTYRSGHIFNFVLGGWPCAWASAPSWRRI